MTVIEHEPEVLAEPFEVEVDEVRQVFWDAADLIEEKGWIRNRGRSEFGFCLMGALFEIVSGGASFGLSGPRNKLWEAITARTAFAFPHGDPVGWNDYYACSKEEVVAKLREIADS